jgi:hypothetical protein
MLDGANALTFSHSVHNRRGCYKPLIGSQQQVMQLAVLAIFPDVLVVSGLCSTYFKIQFHGNLKCVVAHESHLQHKRKWAA